MYENEIIIIKIWQIILNVIKIIYSIAEKFLI